jgi:ribosomal protein S27AE
VLNVESLHFGYSDRGHAFNRRLRRWMKGFLQHRLDYKAELNGVELNVVNAAYTSQTCPRCGFTSSKNRHAAKFKCGFCGYAGSADAVAATNILRRGSDPAITRFMPSGAVKQILEERWRAALNGGAWGSNGVALGTDVTEINVAAGAANNCVRSPSVLGSNEQSATSGLELVHVRPSDE